MTLRESDYVKIVVAVPVAQAAAVRQAMNEAGASRQGNYEMASSSVRTVGRFRPLPGAHPAVGAVGQLEEVDEELVMTLCHTDKVAAVIRAVRRTHPYEEPAIDIFPRYDSD